MLRASNCPAYDSNSLKGYYYPYTYDSLNRLIETTDNQNNKTKYQYDSYGNQQQKAPTTHNQSYEKWQQETSHLDNPFTYIGQYYDEESDLYYLRARYYDPTIQRFITEDSYKGDIREPLSLNQYTYCENNPIKYVDPSGHVAQVIYNVPTIIDGAKNAWGSTIQPLINTYGPEVIQYIEQGIETAPQVLEGIKLSAQNIGNNIKNFFTGGSGGQDPNKRKDKSSEAYVPEDGSKAITVPQKVIGHYPEYVELSTKLNTKPFSIPDNIWNKMTSAEQWAANEKFLDRAISKGTEFNLATPIDKVRPGSYLQKEIEYLMSQGYKLSSDGTKLIK